MSASTNLLIKVYKILKLKFFSLYLPRVKNGTCRYSIFDDNIFLSYGNLIY